jgi:hypothetical protein
VITTGAWVVVGLAVAVAGSRMQFGTLAAPGSGFLPTVAGLALAGLGAAVLVVEWVAKRSRVPDRAPAVPAAARWQVGATAASLVAYGVLLGTLGFALTTLLVLGVLFQLVARLGWVASIGWTIGATVFSHVLFRVWLKVPFPPGLWGF